MKLHQSIPESSVAKICCAVFIAMLFTACTGCEVANIDDDGFGRIRSNSGYGAIDGISGFVHLLESRGLDVRQSSRISPVIERYNTIVWAPDRVLPPSKAAIKRLKTWVNDGYASRRLIFIGPGFRSRKLLDQKQIELAGDENLERAIRRYNEKLIRYPHPYHYRYVEEESCDWYDLTRIDNQPIKTITGPWSNSLSTGETELYTGIYDFKIPSEIRPKNSPSTSPNSKRAVVLLSGDGHDLVYRIPAKKKFQNYGYYDGDGYEERIDETAGIFVVSNGSFIQNYGLVNPAPKRPATDPSHRIFSPRKKWLGVASKTTTPRNRTVLFVAGHVYIFCRIPNPRTSQTNSVKT